MQGNNNEISVSCFLLGLEAAASARDPAWRDSHIILMDNCASHKTYLVRKLLKILRLQVIYSAPASFLAILVELAFGALKAKDFKAIENNSAEKGSAS